MTQYLLIIKKCPFINLHFVLDIISFPSHIDGLSKPEQLPLYLLYDYFNNHNVPAISLCGNIKTS